MLDNLSSALEMGGEFVLFSYRKTLCKGLSAVVAEVIRCCHTSTEYSCPISTQKSYQISSYILVIISYIAEIEFPRNRD